jgi:hypothetical protein
MAILGWKLGTHRNRVSRFGMDWQWASAVNRFSLMRLSKAQKSRPGAGNSKYIQNQAN